MAAELIAVKGDKCDHGDGDLHADNNTGKVFISGKKVVYKASKADDDGQSHGGDDDAAQGSSEKVFAEGIKIHRNNDARACGSKTNVVNQTKVFSN